MDEAERARRVHEVYEPYRRAVVQSLARAAEQRGGCVHLSVHSFTPVVDGKRRDADVGLLYDPARPNERSFARRWAEALGASGLRVRLELPVSRHGGRFYEGSCAGMFPAARYTGLELELSQALLADRRRRMHIARVTELAFAASLAAESRP